MGEKGKQIAMSLGFIEERNFKPIEGRASLIAAETSLSTASLRLLLRGGGGVMEAWREDKREEMITGCFRIGRRDFRSSVFEDGTVIYRDYIGLRAFHISYSLMIL